MPPKSQLTRLPRRGRGGGGGDTGGHNYDLHTLVRLAPHALGYLRGYNGDDPRQNRLERDTFMKCSGCCWIRRRCDWWWSKISVTARFRPAMVRDLHHYDS